MTAPGTPQRVLVIGNSDGIGKAVTEKLLARGDAVTGISRSPLECAGDYQHHTCDVAADDYPERLAAIWAERGPFEVVLFCVGIGEGFRPNMSNEFNVFDVNLMGLVRTLEVAVPAMTTAKTGHILGLSSLADEGYIPDAPSYCASKAAFSRYLVSLAFKLKPLGVSVTNIRFGFVDTKMAKAKAKPLMIDADKAADLVLRCLRRKPVQFSYPKLAALGAQIFRSLGAVRVWLSG